jgi:hypothetical protein
MGEPEPDLFNFTSVPDGYRNYLQPAVFDPWARKPREEQANRNSPVVMKAVLGSAFAG